MKSNKIRQEFVNFFEQHGHTPVESSPVVPRNDPTLLFTNAGMNQFKDVFMGLDKRPYTRATSFQKCIRAGGKHNDLENVGNTPRHHTFFEMLGNFSFGDYFKDEAIGMAWDLITKKFEIPAEHLWVSVYQDDDEAENIWKKIVPASRIVRLGKKDNFWEMGTTGPCGPCTEIHVDLPTFFGDLDPSKSQFDDEKCLEIWNLVFMQYNRQENGEMSPLPRPSVDTGAGLERFASVLQRKQSNYETDVFTGLIEKVVDLSNTPYIPLEFFGSRQMSAKEIEAGMAHRVIADHIRALAFAIADGAVPSNEGRGYVLRRILRRAARYGRKIGIDKPFLSSLLPVLNDNLAAVYPVLNERQEHISSLIKMEEERFSNTLENGISLFNSMVDKKGSSQAISGDDAFKLYDTYGFPLDITQDMARERGLAVDNKGFQECLQEQRTRAKNARSVVSPQLNKGYEELYQAVGDTEFAGYDQISNQTKIVALLDKEGHKTESLSAEGWVIVDQTPFYGESGGQIGDIGTLTTSSGAAKVIDVQRPVQNLFAHKVKMIDGCLNLDDAVTLTVDADNRKNITRHHTAAHLFHAALHKVVGVHATQAGSAVNNSRMRFDFNHHTGLTKEQIYEIEKIVNQIIIDDLAVVTTEVSVDEAKEAGAMMLFDEKYSQKVRMVKIDQLSCELCGGTHVSRTGSIGFFQIVEESAVAAGIRRVEAICGMPAVLLSQKQRQLIEQTGSMLGSSISDISIRIEKILAENKSLAKKLKEARSVSTKDILKLALEAKKDCCGTNLIAFNLGEVGVDALRPLADQISKQFESHVIVLAATADGKCNLITQVSADQVKAGRHAGNIIREVAKVVGGGGGGKPNIAQAGGKNPAKIEEALNLVETLLNN